MHLTHRQTDVPDVPLPVREVSTGPGVPSGWGVPGAGKALAGVGAAPSPLLPLRPPQGQMFPWVNLFLHLSAWD